MCWRAAVCSCRSTSATSADAHSTCTCCGTGSTAASFPDGNDVTPRSIPLVAAAWLLALLGAAQPAEHVFAATASAAPAHPPSGVDLFTLSTNCMACHNGMAGPSGNDVSIGTAW